MTDWHQPSSNHAWPIANGLGRMYRSISTITGTFTAALTSTLADEWGQRLPRMNSMEDMLPSGQLSRLHLKTFEGHRKKIEEEIPVLLPYHHKPGFSLELEAQITSQFEGIPTLARAIDFGKLVVAGNWYSLSVWLEVTAILGDARALR